MDTCIKLETITSLDGALVHHCPTIDLSMSRNTNNAPTFQMDMSAKLVMIASLDGVLEHHCLAADLAVGRNTNKAPQHKML